MTKPPVEPAAPREAVWRRILRRSRHIHPSLLAPLAMVVIAVAFNLWYLRGERLVVSYPNDSQTHLMMAQWAEKMLAHGQLPFDHWFAHLSLGSPFFVQYQSASAVFTGALGLVFGTKATFAWTLYLLLALWPICVYVTARLLGWGRWESGISALVAPLLFSVTGRGFEDQAYNWLGSGLWSELWAMWSLPLALGFCWRYVSKRQYLFGAVAITVLTIAFHFLMAYLIAMVLVLLVVLRPSDVLGRLRRGALVGGLALLGSLWVTLPLWSIRKFTAYNEFQRNTWIDDSYGPGKVLKWLFTGQIFDYQRFPIVTLLVGVGFVACVARFRRDERSRVLVVLSLLSLFLFFGRGDPHNALTSRILGLLPGNADLLFQRYLAGVHLAGLLLAGVGVVWLVQLAREHVPLRADAPGLPALDTVGKQLGAAVLGIAVLVAVLTPAWTQVRTYNAYNDAFITKVQQPADATQGAEVSALLALAAQQGGGRVYAGEPSEGGSGGFSRWPGWGHGFTVGQVPVYIYMEDSPVDAVGFTLRGFGTMTGPEAWFGPTDNIPGNYDALGIKYLVLPRGMRPPVPATLDSYDGNFRLYTVDHATGIFQVVNTIWPAIAANKDNLGANTSDFLYSGLTNVALYRPIAYDGAAPPTPTVYGMKVSGPAGRVSHVVDDLYWGRASATVDATRTAVVLLSASYDPGWSVTVDGKPAATEMIAPALVGVKVSPGVHQVAFVYHGYGSYPLLFVIALLTLLGVLMGPWLRRRVGRRLPMLDSARETIANRNRSRRS